MQVTFFGYLSQQCYYQAGGNPAEMEGGTTPDSLNEGGHNLRRLAYLCAALSLLAFMIGLWTGLRTLQA